MNCKIYWGLAILIILLLGVSAVLLLQKTDTEPRRAYRDVAPSKDNPPPAEPGYKWVWHHNHWDKVKEDTSSEQRNATPLNTAEYSVTRQGKRYKKNPAHADVPAANATPTGPPLTIDWQDGGHPPPGSVIDWQDPRTWESYRNFWGFEPPTFNPQTGYEYRPRLDNWGTPLQQFRDTFVVFHYKKRIGFRPSPEELAEYKQLQAQLETARTSGDTLLINILRQDIQALMNSARGELPIKHTFHSAGYGPGLDDPEQQKSADEASILDVYRRMGIEHLYEFYEQN